MSDSPKVTNKYPSLVIPGDIYSAKGNPLTSPMATATTIQIKLQNEDGAFVEYWLALALTKVPENSHNLDPVSKFVQVKKAPAGVALEVFSMGNIVDCAHVIREIATSSKTRDGQNK
jgi:hypothetical protein